MSPHWLVKCKTFSSDFFSAGLKPIEARGNYVPEPPYLRETTTYHCQPLESIRHADNYFVPISIRPIIIFLLQKLCQITWLLTSWKIFLYFRRPLWGLRPVAFGTSATWFCVCCVLSNVGGSEKSQLWVVVGGSEKNRLWCVATGMSGKQCHSKCSLFRVTTFCVNTCFQSFSTLISRIVHDAVLKFSPCCNKPLPQASTCPHQYTRSSCSAPQTQYCQWWAPVAKNS